MDETLAPWSRPDLLPAKPDADSYGYVFRNTLTPCSRETLTERCLTQHGSPAMLVWAPEVERLVPAVELPFLHDGIRERLRKTIRLNIKLGCFSLFAYGVWMLAARDERALEVAFFLLLSFGILPLLQGWWQLRQLRQDTWETLATQSVSARYAVWMRRQPKEATWILSAIILVVFILQMAHGLNDSILRAGLTKTGLHPRDAYRFLTGPLMHGGIMHLMMNGVALFVLGMAVEALLDGPGMALIFVVSALGGSALSFVLTSQTSVGASGGIMGLLGCLAVFGYHFRRILPPRFGRQMIYAVFLTALTGLAARHVIDNAAHAGGFLAGAALGWVLVRSRSTLPFELSRPARWAGLLALILVFVAAGIITKLMWPG